MDVEADAVTQPVAEVLRVPGAGDHLGADRVGVGAHGLVAAQGRGARQQLLQLGLGAVAERNRDVPGILEAAFAKRARGWHEWRANLVKHARPDAALRIAELVLKQSEDPGDWSKFAPAGKPAAPEAPAPSAPAVVTSVAADRASGAIKVVLEP